MKNSSPYLLKLKGLILHAKHCADKSKGRGRQNNNDDGESGARLCAPGKKVLLVDLDPREISSSWLGLDIHNLSRSMYNVFLEEVYFEEILTKTCAEI